MKRRIALLVGALSLTTVGFAGIGPAAQAADKPPVQAIEEAVVTVHETGDVSTAADCADNRICLYENDWFTGRTYLEMSLRQSICSNLPSGFGNWASSHKNTYNRSVWFYDRSSCAGSHGYSAAPESRDGDLTDNGFDNKTSSLLL
ncbi:peptidase inhibitor family I36 protein [Nonomuraea longicatena]|uniref:Peptidase inhibitor family I36 n=1 Tax=Nonomuraea longicatena TaxID=83682 RepID=A0ABN1R8B7_9ACTN